MKIRRIVTIFLAIALLLVVVSYQQHFPPGPPNGIAQVKITDAFCGPKFEEWHTTTINDVFNKFEGKYHPNASASLEKDFEKSGATRNAFYF